MEDNARNIAYKYRPSVFHTEHGKFTRQILDDSTLYFSKAKHFNDPFEILMPDHEAPNFTRSNFANLWAVVINSSLEWQHLNTQDKVLNGLLFNAASDHILKDTAAALSPFYLDAIHEVRAFCLNQRIDDVLSWSHYADSHRGLAFGFDLDLLRFEPPSEFMVSYDPIPINYVTHELNAMLHEHTPHSFAMQQMSTKSYHWAYEKEVRYLVSPFINKIRINDLKYIIITPLKNAILESQEAADYESWNSDDWIKLYDSLESFDQLEKLYSSYGKDSYDNDRYAFKWTLETLFRSIGYKDVSEQTIKQHVLENGNLNISFNKEALVEVVFGCNMSDKEVKLHMDLFKKKGFNPKFSKMAARSAKFDLIQGMP